MTIKLSSITLTYDQVYVPETCSVFLNGKLHLKIRIHPIHGLMAIHPISMAPVAARTIGPSSKFSLTFRSHMNKSFYYLSKLV